MNEAVELAEKILSVYRENKVNVAVGSDGFPNVMLCGGSGLGNGIYQHCAEEAAVGERHTESSLDPNPAFSPRINYLPPQHEFERFCAYWRATGGGGKHLLCSRYR